MNLLNIILRLEFSRFQTTGHKRAGPFAQELGKASVGKPSVTELPLSPRGEDSEVSMSLAFPNRDWLPLSDSTCALRMIPSELRMQLELQPQAFSALLA